jgi:DNA primase
MFPIHNEAGKIIGFGGRALAADDEPKYLNSPETSIYKKSYVLYNLHRAKEAIRKQDRVILVEGYMDAIGVTAAGFAEVVASCGTSLTTQQVHALKRHCEKILVNFDPDGPGNNAAERSINTLLEEGMRVHIVELGRDLDPDEYCKEHGASAYEARLASAGYELLREAVSSNGTPSYFHWLANRARQKHDIHTPEGAVAALKSVLPAIERLTDPLARGAVANDIAARIGVSAGMVLDSFRRAAVNRQEKALARPKVTLRADERMLLNALLGDPEVRQAVVGQLRGLDAVSRFTSRRVFQAIFALEDAGERVSFDNVHARLEDSDRELLAEVILNEEEEFSPEAVEAALDSVRVSEGQQRRNELKARIKECERSGKWDEALQLMADLRALEQDVSAVRGRS